MKAKLVIGPSSVGKSVFITCKLVNSESVVLMANMLNENCVLGNDYIIHYNAFRPYKNSSTNLDYDFLIDPALNFLLKEKNNLEVYFLVTNKSKLLKRIIERKKVEPLFDKLAGSYPFNKMIDLVCNLDYPEFYEKWFTFFNQHSISIKLIDSSNYEYKELSGIEQARSIIQNNEKEEYTKEEIQEALNRFDFGYQKIELPFDLSTKGNSRSESMNLILDDDINNKSVLDIGCAYGYFCFEAEKKGAKKIYGTELKTERFVGANVIKEIVGSNVVFLKKDVILNKIGQTFDVVLLLNVLHHLKYPIYALKVLSELCTEKMIIEFPTLADNKFQSTFPNQITDKEAPLIGVSLYEDRDQTFLFNDEAIKRILLEHNQFFRKVEFHDSPFEKARRIAICYK